MTQPSYIEFIIGGKSYSINSEIFKQIKEEKPSMLPTRYNNPAFQFKAQERYDDRDPECFEIIMRYYRTGHLIFPKHLLENPDFLKGELDFWMIEFKIEEQPKKEAPVPAPCPTCLENARRGYSGHIPHVPHKPRLPGQPWAPRVPIYGDPFHPFPEPYDLF